MKYTFVTEGTEKTVEIDDAWIAKQRTNLRISTKEAIMMWLSDEGYISDPTVEELTQKAKGDGVKAKRKAPKRKEDPAKRAIINGVYQFLLGGGIDDKLMFGRTVAPIEIENPERVINFSIGNDDYSLTLSKKRKQTSECESSVSKYWRIPFPQI